MASSFGFINGQATGDWPFFNGVEWVASHLYPSVYLLVPKYLGVGFSTTKPTNQNAGDLTASRIIVPDQTLSSLAGAINAYSTGNVFVARMDSAGGAGYLVQGAAVPPAIYGYRSQGTITNPTAVAINNVLLGLYGFGFYDSIGGVSSSRLSFQLRARQAWTSTAQGTYAAMGLTSNGATTEQTSHYWFYEGYETSGYVAAGYDNTAPATAANGRVIASDAVYPGDDAQNYLKLTSSKPTWNADTNDYIEYDRSGNKWNFVVGSSTVASIGSTGYRANRTRTMYLDARAAGVSHGVPDWSVRGANTIYGAYAMDSASTEGIIWELSPPADYVSGAITATLDWTNLGAGSGNVVLRFFANSTAVGGDYNSAAGLVLGTSTTIAAPAASIRASNSLAITFTPVAGSTFVLGVQRLGADAADTLANDIGVIGVTFSYTADS